MQTEPSQLPAILAAIGGGLTFLTLLVTAVSNYFNESRKRRWMEEDRQKAERDREKAEEDRKMAEKAATLAADTNRKAEVLVEKTAVIHDLTNSAMSKLKEELAAATQQIKDQNTLLARIAESKITETPPPTEPKPPPASL